MPAAAVLGGTTEAVPQTPSPRRRLPVSLLSHFIPPLRCSLLPLSSFLILFRRWCGVQLILPALSVPADDCDSAFSRDSCRDGCSQAIGVNSSEIVGGHRSRQRRDQSVEERRSDVHLLPRCRHLLAACQWPAELILWGRFEAGGATLSMLKLVC